MTKKQATRRKPVVARVNSVVDPELQNGPHFVMTGSVVSGIKDTIGRSVHAKVPRKHMPGLVATWVRQELRRPGGNPELVRELIVELEAHLIKVVE